MAQEFLHGADVVAVFEEVGGKAVAKGVGADRLIDAGPAGGLTDGLLQTAFVQVVAAHDAAARVHGQTVRRKDVLPAPFSAGVGVLAFQGVGQASP